MRESRIELLRIFCMIGIIIGHICNPTIGGGFNEVSVGSINYYALCFMVSLTCCTTNVFFLINGYFLCSKFEREYSKIISLLVQVVIFKIAINIDAIINGETTFIGVVGNNYFIILYITVYLISPYINIIICKLDIYQLRCKW